MLYVKEKYLIIHYLDMMHGLFFWNQIDVGRIKSPYLLDLLKEWFSINLDLKAQEPTILGNVVERSLNDLEFGCFEFDPNYAVNPITVGNRLAIKNIVNSKKK